MSDVTKFNTMYDKGVIQYATDFPPLLDRRDGMIFNIWTENRIGDPYVYTEKDIMIF